MGIATFVRHGHCAIVKLTGVPGLMPLFGPLCAALGRSGSLCCQSWGDLGMYAGDLGPIWASLGGPEPLLRRL